MVSRRLASLLLAALLASAARPGLAAPATGPGPAPVPPAATPPAAKKPAAATPEAKLPPGTFGRYLSGIVAGGLGDADTASDRLLGVVKADPGALGVRSKAFVFAALAGRPEGAALAHSFADNPLSPLILGDEAASKGDWVQAQASFSRIDNSQLNALLQPLLVAWSLQGAGRTVAAINTLTSLAQGGLVGGIYALYAAMIADQAHRDSQAAILYQEALSLYPGSDLVFVQSYASFLARTGHPEAGRNLVHALVRALPMLAVSESRLDRAIVHAPFGDAVGGLARCYLVVANLTEQQGASGREAEGFMLRLALDLDPGLTPARLLMAELQGTTGSPQQAVQILRHVAKDDPLQPVVELRIGIAQDQAGDRDGARSTLRRLAAAYPGKPAPLQALGDLLQETGAYGEAIRQYDRAIRAMSPLGSQDWPILFARATAYDRNRQWPKAQQDLQAALRLAPNQPLLLNYLGYSWTERRQDLPRARVLIQRALDAKPEDGSIRDSLGWAMYQQNDITGAVRQLEHAAEQIPEDPTVNFHLGAAYWAAGRKVEARDQWRWALLLHPAKADADRIRTALRVSASPGADPVLAAEALPPSVP